MENFIEIDSDKDVLRVELRKKGKKTGLYWQFDIEDIALPLKVSEMFRETKENEKWAKAKMIAINKKEDVPYDDILTRNEKEQIEVMKEYYDRQSKALDLVLGDGGTRTFLEVQGREPYYTMHYDIMKYLDKIKPMLDENLKSVSEIIKEKYNIEEEDALQ